MALMTLGVPGHHVLLANWYIMMFMWEKQNANRINTDNRVLKKWLLTGTVLQVLSKNWNKNLESWIFLMFLEWSVSSGKLSLLHWWCQAGGRDITMCKWGDLFIPRKEQRWNILGQDCAMNAFDNSKPREMGIICLLHSVNKYLLNLSLVSRTARKSLWQTYEELELIRLSESRWEKREKSQIGERTKTWNWTNWHNESGLSDHYEKWLLRETSLEVPGAIR